MLLALIAVLGASGWVAFTTFRRFARQEYPLPWRVASVVLSVTGIGLGYWFLTREYHTSPTVRAIGYPFPVGAAELIDGRWLGGLVSRFLILAFAADIAAGIGICLLPLRIGQIIFERGVRDDSTPKAA